MSTTDPRLVRALGDLFGIPAADVRPDADLQDDLHLDSLAQVELQVALEDELGVRLRVDEPESVRTLGDLQRVVMRRLKAGEPAIPTLDLRADP